MGIRWKTFEIPKRLEIDKSTQTPTYGKFVAEPFERGYGTTIGNSLRRVLISSIDGAAVTRIKIDGVLHEFSAVQGVLEDGAQLVLNLKTLVLRYHGRGPKQIFLDVKKEGPVTARDIQADETIEIVNPDLVICHLTKETHFRMEMDVDRGRGYVPAERNKIEGSPIGSIPIDSIFSPVTRVNFHVENSSKAISD